MPNLTISTKMDKKKDKGEKKEKTVKKSKNPKSSSDSGEDKSKTASKTVNILDEAAMENAYNICHNVQDLLYFRLKNHCR